jgi:hypothetical protein
LAEAQKISGERFRQNGEIALHIAGREAGGRRAMSCANGKPGGQTAAGCGFFVSAEGRNGHWFDPVIVAANLAPEVAAFDDVCLFPGHLTTI